MKEEARGREEEGARGGRPTDIKSKSTGGGREVKRKGAVAEYLTKMKSREGDEGARGVQSNKKIKMRNERAASSLPAQEDLAEEQRRTPRTNKTRGADKKSGGARRTRAEHQTQR